MHIVPLILANKYSVETVTLNTCLSTITKLLQLHHNSLISKSLRN